MPEYNGYSLNSSTEIPDVLYQDFDMNFLANPNSGDVPLLKNSRAIIQSVKNLVLTNMYDNFYNPGIYSGILAALFENFDPILVTQLQNAIRDVITNYEPRAQYLDCLITSDESLDKNQMNLKIYVRPITAKVSIEILMTLERIR